jgi:hypothetical protein
MIFKQCKNMKINVCHSIAHMALSRTGGAHQPVTVVSKILVDMGEAIYAMTRSVPKSFAAFLISSATNVIAKQNFRGRC